MMQPPAAGGEQQKNQPMPPHPWMPMQYPAATAAAMAMQHQMMGVVPPHYLPYPPPLQYHQPPPSPAPAGWLGPSSSEENKSIWIGDLHFWMDENYLHSCFGHTGEYAGKEEKEELNHPTSNSSKMEHLKKKEFERKKENLARINFTSQKTDSKAIFRSIESKHEVTAIKVIRNKHTGQSEGYGFVEFCTHAAAEKVLQTFNGHLMPNAEHSFRLNWASFSMGERRSDTNSDYSIFVGDLASDVTDAILQDTFSCKYPSVKGAKVVVDANTGRSKGYGFVRFGDDNEKALAMTEMNGQYCSSRPMRIGTATPRKSSTFGSNSSSGQSYQSDVDSTNTTVFVGGLDSTVSEDELRQSFSQYGDIATVKIPVGKQCGFVQFVHRSNAEEALHSLNGTMLGKQAVRLSWGRNPGNKQFRGDLTSPWNGLYYGPQMYGGYGFAAPPPDPMMYAAAYGAYPMYGNKQQVS